jgi:hypothetical protein
LCEHTDGIRSRKLCELFEELPDFEEYPDYYDVVTNPISLKEIKQKIDKAQYATLQDMGADIRLMVDNAQTFNEPGSEVYADANEIWEFFNSFGSKGTADQAGDEVAEELDELSYKRVLYNIGMWVYVSGNDLIVPRVGMIKRIWKTSRYA